jgi:hypothetical protein
MTESSRVRADAGRPQGPTRRVCGSGRPCGQRAAGEAPQNLPIREILTGGIDGGLWRSAYATRAMFMRGWNGFGLATP